MESGFEKLVDDAMDALPKEFRDKMDNVAVFVEDFPSHEQVMKSGQYAFRDRRAKKRDFRRLWIARISAACTDADIKYSQLINGLTKAGIQVNRKMLSEMAIADAEAFKAVVAQAKAALA